MLIKKTHLLITFGVTLVIAGLLSPLASPNPDGLERVAEDYGFMERAINVLRAPIPDYVLPGFSNEALATGLAGIIGTTVVFLVAYGVGRVLTKARHG